MFRVEAEAFAFAFSQIHLESYRSIAFHHPQLGVNSISNLGWELV